MFWVLKITVSQRQIFWAPKTYDVWLKQLLSKSSKPDKSVGCIITFPFTKLQHMLWVLKRTLSLRSLFFKEVIYSGTSILSFYILSNDESFESLRVLFIDQNP